jgi:hypothetical protein
LSLAKFDISGAEVKTELEFILVNVCLISGDSLFIGFIVEDKEQNYPKIIL